jgi:hypothetical protein
MTAVAFPLPLRNALAELALAAFGDDAARGALAWLAAPATAPAPEAAARLAAVHLIDAGDTALMAVHAPWRAAIRSHAARALGAATAEPLDTGEPVARAARQAAALWREGLFFEVHEVLEAVWQRERGDRRHALQGVIQIAVAWHHLAHGNRRGARRLLREGRARLAAVPSDAVSPLDLAALLDATVAAEVSLAAAEGPVPDPPVLALRH